MLSGCGREKEGIGTVADPEVVCTTVKPQLLLPASHATEGGVPECGSIFWTHTAPRPSQCEGPEAKDCLPLMLGAPSPESRKHCP